MTAKLELLGYTELYEVMYTVEDKKGLRTVTEMFENVYVIDQDNLSKIVHKRLKRLHPRTKVVIKRITRSKKHGTLSTASSSN